MLIYGYTDTNLEVSVVLFSKITGNYEFPKHRFLARATELGMDFLLWGEP